jgi:amidase
MNAGPILPVTATGGTDDAARRDAVLEVSGLHAGYGHVPVLHGISFTLREGEAIGIVGHNGMGKSTLLKCVMGLLPARGGRIALDGTDVTRAPAHQRSRLGMGYVPQGRGILPGLTALENLRLAWSADTGETEQQSLERVLELFPRLRRLLDRKGGALSGGEQQLLALARALMAQPWLLLLDEPSEGIQPSIVQEIGQTLAALRDTGGLTIVIVEQNLDLVLDVAGRVLVLERGRVAQTLDGAALRGPAVSELLGLGAARMTTRGAGHGPSTGSAPHAPPGGAKVAAESPSSGEMPRGPGPAAQRWTGRGQRPDAHRASAGAARAGSAPSAPPSPSVPPRFEAPAAASALAPLPTPSPRTAAPARPTSAASAAPNPTRAAATPGETMTSVKRPTLEQLKSIVSDLHMSMSDREVAEYLEVLEGTFKSYDRIAALPDNLPAVRYPRTPGYKPAASENPMNAWAVKSEVRGAAHGPLAGKRIVLKDNVCLAGVPMMNGATSLEGYVPDVDATLVTRILDAGGTIVGKAHCESFCLSGGSHTSQSGPVHNPWKYGYSAGGSSSGSASLVGAGEVEMAIGGDQGGSIRMPAGWSGCYGMKPTHGLVPYTGVMPIEATIDHAGPMTTTVADNALLLEAIAGPDGLDPRQYNVRVDRYTAALGRGVAGMRIGVLVEGFGHANSEPDVDAKVRDGANRLRALGAHVEDVSVPMHLDGGAIWTPIALEGLMAQMMHGNGMGFNWEGLYTTSLLDAHANWRSRANELSRTLKVSMFAGEYFIRQYRGHFYAKAQNLARQLRGSYDEALSRYDLLLLPTLPMKATPIPPQNAPLALWCQRGFEMLANTCPFDVSGHPAMSIPCGLSQGLPVGLMLVAKHWGESTIYRAAHAFEQSADWREL